MKTQQAFIANVLRWHVIRTHDEVCGAKSESEYICTQPLSHNGFHIASDHTARVLDVWLLTPG
jgi:hypothetical protein